MCTYPVNIIQYNKLKTSLYRENQQRLYNNYWNWITILQNIQS